MLMPVRHATKRLASSWQFCSDTHSNDRSGAVRRPQHWQHNANTKQQGWGQRAVHNSIMSYYSRHA
jgi:hypothetical protein